jgi:hypothetical protein
LDLLNLCSLLSLSSTTGEDCFLLPIVFVCMLALVEPS